MSFIHRTSAVGFWGTTLAQALVLGSLSPVPAGAVVIRGAKTKDLDQAREQASHKQALEQKCVVGLRIYRGKATVPVTGAGVFRGVGKDQATGYVVTVASLFQKGSQPTQEELDHKSIITFGPQNGPGSAEDTLEVPVTQVLIHDRYETWEEDHGYFEDKRIPRHRNDVAVLCFDASGRKDLLDKLGVKAAQFYQGKGYEQGDLMDGLVVGPGLFGTNAHSVLDACNGRFHAGNLKVFHGAYGRKRKAFMHYAPLTSGGIGDRVLKLSNPLKNGARFSGYKDLTTFRDVRVAKAASKVPVQFHPNECMTEIGDEGAPLFFQTKAGMVVAGLASEVLFAPLWASDGTNLTWKMHAADVFEPLAPHLSRIDAVLDGVTSGFRALKRTGSPDSKSGSETVAGPLEGTPAWALEPVTVTNPFDRPWKLHIQGGGPELVVLATDAQGNRTVAWTPALDPVVVTEAQDRFGIMEGFQLGGNRLTLRFSQMLEVPAKGAVTLALSEPRKFLDLALQPVDADGNTHSHGRLQYHVNRVMEGHEDPGHFRAYPAQVMALDPDHRNRATFTAAAWPAGDDVTRWEPAVLQGSPEHDFWDKEEGWGYVPPAGPSEVAEGKAGETTPDKA